jgi:hypothetical protein
VDEIKNTRHISLTAKWVAGNSHDDILPLGMSLGMSRKANRTRGSVRVMLVRNVGLKGRERTRHVMKLWLKIRWVKSEASISPLDYRELRKEATR